MDGSFTIPNEDPKSEPTKRNEVQCVSNKRKARKITESNIKKKKKTEAIGSIITMYKR